MHEHATTAAIIEAARQVVVVKARALYEFFEDKPRILCGVLRMALC
jgi:hypothetical protein